jgi:hypothetical protein
MFDTDSMQKLWVVGVGVGGEFLGFCLGGGDREMWVSEWVAGKGVTELRKFEVKGGDVVYVCVCVCN